MCVGSGETFQIGTVLGARQSTVTWSQQTFQGKQMMNLIDRINCVLPDLCIISLNVNLYMQAKVTPFYLFEKTTLHNIIRIYPATT